MPTIVGRSSWGANPLQTPAGSIRVPSQYLWLHHTASTGLHGASGMRSLQSNAIAGGYSDLEYTYVVDQDSTIYESRGPGRNTAAQNAPGGPDNNAISHAICVMGNFETVDRPTDKLINTLGELVRWMHDNGWTPNQITGPHKSAPGCSTACCGKNLIAVIDDINRVAMTGRAPTPVYKGGAVGAVRTPSGQGYYICDSTGAVFAYGDAKYVGGANNIKLAAPIVGMDVTPNNGGYILAASDGGTFAYGNGNNGKGGWSMGGKKLAAPVVDIQITETGKGLWLFAQDGGVFAFGDAEFRGAPTGMVK